MTFCEFMTVCGSFAFIKEKRFGRTHIQPPFSRKIQEFFQESNCIPGVSRSSGHPVLVCELHIYMPR